MVNNHEFYPMITQTVKTLIRLIGENERQSFLFILQNYPNISKFDEQKVSPALSALVYELDRQYARWNKKI